jgi:hypothetical protein
LLLLLLLLYKRFSFSLCSVCRSAAVVAIVGIVTQLALEISVAQPMHSKETFVYYLCIIEQEEKGRKYNITSESIKIV